VSAYILLDGSYPGMQYIRMRYMLIYMSDSCDTWNIHGQKNMNICIIEPCPMYESVMVHDLYISRSTHFKLHGVVCACVYTSAYMYVWVCVCVSVWECVCLCVYTHLCTHLIVTHTYTCRFHCTHTRASYTWYWVAKAPRMP